MNDKLRLPLCDNDECSFHDVFYPLKNLHEEVTVEVVDPQGETREVTNYARTAATTHKTVRFCHVCFNAVATASEALKSDPGEKKPIACGECD